MVLNYGICFMICWICGRYLVFLFLNWYLFCFIDIFIGVIVIIFYMRVWILNVFFNFSINVIINSWRNEVWFLIVMIIVFILINCMVFNVVNEFSFLCGVVCEGIYKVVG